MARPRKYQTDAERQRAFRQHRLQALAELKQAVTELQHFKTEHAPPPRHKDPFLNWSEILVSSRNTVSTTADEITAFIKNLPEAPQPDKLRQEILSYAEELAEVATTLNRIADVLAGFRSGHHS